LAGAVAALVTWLAPAVAAPWIQHARPANSPATPTRAVSPIDPSIMPLPSLILTETTATHSATLNNFAPPRRPEGVPLCLFVEVVLAGQLFKRHRQQCGLVRRRRSPESSRTQLAMSPDQFGGLDPDRPRPKGSRLPPVIRNDA
jgi:hypothetical protein